MLREYGEEINPTVPQERRKLFIYKSLTIGISFDGDTEYVLLNNVYFFEENSCDIAIYATRIRIYAPVSMYAEKKGLTVDWVYMPYVEFLPEEKREYVDKAVLNIFLVRYNDRNSQILIELIMITLRRHMLVEGIIR